MNTFHTQVLPHRARSLLLASFAFFATGAVGCSEAGSALPPYSAQGGDAGASSGSAGTSAGGASGNAGVGGALDGSAGLAGGSGTAGASAGAAGASAGAAGASAGAAGASATAGNSGTSGAAGAGAGAAGTSGAGNGGVAGASGNAGAAGKGGGSAGSGGAAGNAGSSGGGGSGGTTHVGSWRIMPLGDSITGTTCYPKLLAQELTSKGHSNFQFVGTVLNNQGCGSAPNVQTEGHGGFLITDASTLSAMPGWFATDQADIVLMQFGTNDVWNSRTTQNILAAYGTAVDDLRAVKANVIVFVAQITPLNPAGCTGCESRVEDLNAQIPNWASGKSTSQSPVYVVDVHSVFDAASYLPNSTYTSDGVHPNPAGSQPIADKWYADITAKGYF